MQTLFEGTGAHVLVDGAFGSTGKGALAAWLADQPGQPEWAMSISSAGPNSGHTFYHNGEKHVLKQLPSFGVAHHLLHKSRIPIILSAGAVVDPLVLFRESRRYPDLQIFVHPNAAIVWQSDKDAEHRGSIAAVSGTRSGTGAALARKVQREPDAIWRFFAKIAHPDVPSNIHTLHDGFCVDTDQDAVFMEVSQGFSLGINSHFYPKVTSRECTVMQAIADARIPPRHVSKTYMSCRTYPIRVGNVDGHSSGDWYDDQMETDWESIGVEPERTTVTNRIRRVADFSALQFLEAIRANAPDFVFMNFLQYMTKQEQDGLRLLIQRLRDDHYHWFGLIGGWGKESKDICLWEK